MSTPLGDIYTTNITPDVETGIGGYSLQDFTLVLREGESPKGHLYPAMPYTAYAKAPIKIILSKMSNGTAVLTWFKVRVTVVRVIHLAGLLSKRKL